MEMVTKVSAALICDGDRFMICRRPPYKARGGLWEFVGGKVEEGETGKEALARECREELDVDIEVGDLYMTVVHEYPDLTAELSLYKAKISSGTPKLLEHTDLRFILPDEIPLYEFCPADKTILERIVSDAHEKKAPEAPENINRRKPMNEYLALSPEVEKALEEGKPVVALESTIISHGMPYPQNVETALRVEDVVRQNGAVPATVAIIGGKLKAGLTKEEIEYLGKKGQAVAKASRRDLPVLAAKKADGATTVAATMIIAAMAGIRVFATGGIGGVHRGAETSMDISADLEELASTPVMVVCAGAKSILDLGLTLEYLETKGVPVIGYGTGELPAFYTRKSGFKVDYRLDTPGELAAAFRAKLGMGLKGGMLVTNPIPEEYSMDPDIINAAIEKALDECRKQGVKGKETTPFLLAKVKELTGGDSLNSNIQLVLNNAALAAKTAKALAEG
ncbi:MAG: pseudouridine-5'-phosphate glycosidase [Clostridia bacterium]|nr:pseudouridine-5'-phosphate glycosidase [Clostridia bacterium]